MSELEKFILENLSELRDVSDSRECAVEAMVRHENKKPPHLRSKSFLISCSCKRCKKEFLA